MKNAMAVDSVMLLSFETNLEIDPKIPIYGFGRLAFWIYAPGDNPLVELK